MLSVQQLTNQYDWDYAGQIDDVLYDLGDAFLAKVVLPPTGSASQVLSEAQYSLTRALGRLFDVTVLSSDFFQRLEAVEGVAGYRTTL